MIIPVYNGALFLERCLTALKAQESGTPEVICVDNASGDGSADLIAARFPWVRLLRNGRNVGFSVACNQGLRLVLAGAPNDAVLVLLNQDTEVEAGWLAALQQGFAQAADVGALGCKIYGYDGLLQHVGGRLELPRATAHLVGLGEQDVGQYEQPAERDYLHGAALALRAEALRISGLLDERFSPAYMEEVDLCWRLRIAGWRVLYQPAARLRHFEHGSPLTIVPRLTLLHRNRLRFVFKHLQADYLLQQFWPAERRALGSLVGGFDEPALRRAYLDALLALDTLLAARADIHLSPFTPAERREAVAMLRELRADLSRLSHLARYASMSKNFEPLSF